MKKVACTVFALLTLAAIPAISAAAASADLHLTVGGVSDGQVFSVNQQFAVSPVWVNGTPDYVGGAVEYLWSPQELVASRPGDGAVFEVPERLDSFEFFVSAETTGLGAWVAPIDLSARIGGGSVVIAGLSDAAAPHVNYLEEQQVPRTVAAGEHFVLAAQWRNAGGAQTNAAPKDVRYVWTCREQSASSVQIDGSGLSANVTAQHPGSYEYTLSCYDLSDRLLCDVTFPVSVTGNVAYTIDVECTPPADHHVVRIMEGDTAQLSAILSPSPSAEPTYTWQFLNEEGLWEDSTAADGAVFEFDADGQAPGTTVEVRCLARTDDWAGVTPILYVEVTDPHITFEQNPYDLAAPAGLDSAPEMIAAAAHPAEYPVSAHWQFRQNASSPWRDAGESVPGFAANEPRQLSSTLTLFSWTATGTGSEQNGEYRCICSGTSSSPALLLILPEQEDTLDVTSPLTAADGGSLGTILTGLDAPAADHPFTAEDLCAMVSPGGSSMVCVAQQTRIMSSSETVGTGCQLQIVEPVDTISAAGLVVLRGDVNGTGVLGITQLVRMARALRDEDASPLLGPFLLAGDFDGNGEIDLSDLVGLAGLMLLQSSDVSGGA